MDYFTIKPLAYFPARARHSSESTALPSAITKVRGYNRYEFLYYIPVERVLLSPSQPVIFETARMWQVHAEEVRAMCNLTEEEWPTLINKRGWQQKQNHTAYLVEHYEDCGDDGHTDYCLTGFALVRTEDLDKMRSPDGQMHSYSFDDAVVEVAR